MELQTVDRIVTFTLTMTEEEARELVSDIRGTSSEYCGTQLLNKLGDILQEGLAKAKSRQITEIKAQLDS